MSKSNPTCQCGLCKTPASPPFTASQDALLQSISDKMDATLSILMVLNEKLERRSGR